MSRIASTFAKLKKEGKKAYIGYSMAGFPDEAGSLELGRKLLAAGADLLEIGVPFSDPIADGVVIQRVAELALEKQGSMSMALRVLASLRKETQAPLLLMSYLNPLIARGLSSFAEEAVAAGADGVIVPDMTPEESGILKKILDAQGLDLVFLAAPTSTPERLKKIAKAASGFIYVVSVAGVTGERTAFDARLDKTVAELRRSTDLPLAIGFGVSSPETAREAAAKADGVVVASTVLKGLLDGSDLNAAIEKANTLIDAAHGA
jgi:tryptophan synthase alpha chain